MNTPKIGSKIYMCVVPSNYTDPDYCTTYTRADARELKAAMGGVIIDIDLTPYQQKKIQSMIGA